MLIDFIERLDSRSKQVVAVVVDVAMLPFALWCTLTLRHGHWQLDWVQFWPAFAVTLACVPLFAHLGLYRHIIRYMGREALLAVFWGITITAIALAAVAYMVQIPDFPRSVPAIFWLLSFFYVTITRFAVRSYAESVVRRDVAKKPVAIYGAGPAGAYLAYQLQRGRDYRPVAFLDQNKSLHGNVIQGLKVYPVVGLPQLVSKHVVEQVLIALPGASPEERRRAIETLEPYPVRVRVIPDMDAVVAGAGTVSDIRDVDLSDLLGRDEVVPLPHLLRGSVTNRAVLVTGAGGSIGSELCRQILRLQPRLLVVLDQTEFTLFKVENELRRMRERESLATPVTVVLGSVLDRALMERTMRGYEVETVYHAAAYKHVSVVENNVIQGIKNNTFGTLRAAEAALAAGVHNFILISTDKAVRTRNVMGASKRLAEMALQAMQSPGAATCFSIVRFGNVLVSSGSVVPLFLEQIDKGGPVMVTHAEATRYFMTISEAAALVLQAASLANGGDVFVLDMGKPVNILELAKKTIRLKGYQVRDETTPHGDISIRFTGLRPGEKLNEELLVGDALGTEHRKIMRAEESFLSWSELAPMLAKLERACDSFDFTAVKNFIEGLVDGADLAAQLTELPQRGNVLPLTPRTTPSERERGRQAAPD